MFCLSTNSPVICASGRWCAGRQAAALVRWTVFCGGRSALSCEWGAIFFAPHVDIAQKVRPDSCGSGLKSSK